MNARAAAIRRPVAAAPLPLPAPAPPVPPLARQGRLARIAKILLPLLAIGIAGLIFVWSHVNLEIVRLQISDSALAPQEVDTISMANPQFAGVDAKNRSFNVTAKLATQQPDSSDLIHLQQPHADITLSDGTQVVVHADAGDLERATQLLDLSGAVRLLQSKGYEFHTSRAHIDLGERTATGDAPVEGTGPDGNLQAEGFQIVDQGARIILLGRSRVVVNSRQDQTAP